VETWAYVPEGYRADVPHGIVLWLHGSEGLKEKELAAQWKPLCDRHDLILVAPKGTSGGRRRPGELRLIPAILAPVASSYTIDPARVVVAGREGGGAAAYQAAFRQEGLFRGAAAIEAPLTGAVPERDAISSLAFFVARAAASPLAGPIQQTIARLRAAKFPVTVKELGPQPRDLTPDELAELARWIDTLDRI
jgi:poly(3-hydroxybutyrate) depolymerase